MVTWANLSGEGLFLFCFFFFGKFSVKLTHPINTPLDAFGVGICSTSHGLRAPPQERDLVGEIGAVGSCFGRGLSLEGKSPCLDTGHRSLEKISDIVLKRLPAPPIHFQCVHLPEHSVCAFPLP